MSWLRSTTIQELVIFALAAVVVWVLLSRAVEPNVVLAEHQKTMAAEAQVSTLSTRVAILDRTPVPSSSVCAPAPHC